MLCEQSRLNHVLVPTPISAYPTGMLQGGAKLEIDGLKLHIGLWPNLPILDYFTFS